MSHLHRDSGKATSACSLAAQEKGLTLSLWSGLVIGLLRFQTQGAQFIFWGIFGSRQHGCPLDMPELGKLSETLLILRPMPHDEDAQWGYYQENWCTPFLDIIEKLSRNSWCTPFLDDKRNFKIYFVHTCFALWDCQPIDTSLQIIKEVNLTFLAAWKINFGSLEINSNFMRKWTCTIY